VSFALYVTAFAWLLVRLEGTLPDGKRSASLGCTAGVLYGLASALAMWSVVPAPPSALITWPVSTGACSAVAAWAMASVFNAPRPWLRLWRVVALACLGFVGSVIAQNLMVAWLRP